MAYDLKDKEELKLWILRELGAPVVKVELTEEHLLDSLDNASRWFSAKKGFTRQGFIQLTPGQSCYPLPEDIGTVTDVAFPSASFDINAVFAPWLLPDQQLPWTVISAHGSSMGLYSYWTQALQYVEMGKRLMSAEPDWRQEGRLLYLFGVRNVSGTILLDYHTSRFTVEQLTERDHDLIKRSSMARAKRILGRIRSKYDGFPTAQGNVSLDGQALLAEAAEELAALDEEIASSGYPMGFMVG